MKPLLIVLALSSQALADPRPLPFSYPYMTLPEGSLDIRQYVDLVPVRIVEGDTSVRSQLTTELEYAVSDRLELALSFAFRQDASTGTPFLGFDGISQRARYRFAEAGEWPVDVGVYVEIAELHDQLEFVEKLLLSRHAGGLTLVANLWVEEEYDFQQGKTRYFYNPTFGGSYDVKPWFQLGAEYWVRGDFDDSASRTHYAGPTALLQAEKIWLAVGAYARLDRLGDAPIVDDPYGKLWVRAIVGIDL